MDPEVLYHPADEPTRFVFAAGDYALQPNAFLVIVDSTKPTDEGEAVKKAMLRDELVEAIKRARPLADYTTVQVIGSEHPPGLKAFLLARFGLSGVVSVEAPFKKEQLEEALTIAEDRHRTWLRTVITPVLIRDARGASDASKAGLKHEPTDDAVKARATAKEWGLL